MITTENQATDDIVSICFYIFFIVAKIHGLMCKKLFIRACQSRHYTVCPYVKHEN